MPLASTYFRRGTRGSQPAATAVKVGTLYYVSDESLTERSNGTAWESYTDGVSATPQFTRVGIGMAADANDSLVIAGQYVSPTNDKGNSGTSLTVNWRDGNTQLITLTGNCTLTLSNPQDGARYLLVLEQDGTGSRTVTWPASVKWPAGVAPTLSTAAGKADIVTLAWVAGIGASGNYLAAATTDFTPA